MTVVHLQIVPPIVDPPPAVHERNPIVTGPAAWAIGRARALTRGRAALVAAWDGTPEKSPCGTSRAERFEAATGTRAQDVQRFRRWLAAMPRWRRKLFAVEGRLRWRHLPARVRRGAVRRAAALRKAIRVVAQNNGGRPFRYRKDWIAAVAVSMGVGVASVWKYVRLYEDHGTAGLVDTRAFRVHRMLGDPVISGVDVSLAIREWG
jgi:hypothetical protein